MFEGSDSCRKLVRVGARGDTSGKHAVLNKRQYLIMSAGARSVLVSLWAIDHETTMEFMKAFYKDLSLGCKIGRASCRERV